MPKTLPAPLEAEAESVPSSLRIVCDDAASITLAAAETPEEGKEARGKTPEATKEVDQYYIRSKFKFGAEKPAQTYKKSEIPARARRRCPNSNLPRVEAALEHWAGKKGISRCGVYPKNRTRVPCAFHFAQEECCRGFLVELFPQVRKACKA